MKTLEQVINEAAGKLPECWMIEVNVERGAGWVALYDGRGNSVALDSSGTLVEQVQEAINLALLRSNSVPPEPESEAPEENDQGFEESRPHPENKEDRFGLDLAARAAEAERLEIPL